MDIADFALRFKEEAFFKEKDVVVLVEDFVDEVFWGNVLQRFKPNLSYDFPYYSPKGAAGKSEIMRYENEVCKDLIICRDSDAEHLIEPNAAWVTNPFIFHTELYSWEYHNYTVPVLNQLIRDITLVEFDFTNYVEQFSTIITPLFQLWIYSKKTGNDDLIGNFLTTGQLSELIDYSAVANTIEIDVFLETLRGFVTQRLTTIRESMGEAWYNAALAEITVEVNISAETSYLFLKNKDVVISRFLKPLFENLCNLLSVAKRAEILANTPEAANEIQQNRARNYDNHVVSQNVKTLLHSAYLRQLHNSPHFNTIQAKIQAAWANA